MKPLSVSFSATSNVYRESRTKRFWVRETIVWTGELRAALACGGRIRMHRQYELRAIMPWLAGRHAGRMCDARVQCAQSALSNRGPPV